MGERGVGEGGTHSRMLDSEGWATMYGGGFSVMFLYSRVNCHGAECQRRCGNVVGVKKSETRTRFCAARVAMVKNSTSRDRSKEAWAEGGSDDEGTKRGRGDDGNSERAGNPKAGRCAKGAGQSDGSQPTANPARVM